MSMMGVQVVERGGEASKSRVLRPRKPFECRGRSKALRAQKANVYACESSSSSCSCPPFYSHKGGLQGYVERVTYTSARRDDVTRLVKAPGIRKDVSPCIPGPLMPLISVSEIEVAPHRVEALRGPFNVFIPSVIRPHNVYES